MEQKPCEICGEVVSMLFRCDECGTRACANDTHFAGNEAICRTCIE